MGNIRILNGLRKLINKSMRISDIVWPQAAVAEKACKLPAFPKRKPQSKPKLTKPTKRKRYRPKSGVMFAAYPPKYPPGQ
jgi:hypothetical protein